MGTHETVGPAPAITWDPTTHTVSPQAFLGSVALRGWATESGGPAGSELCVTPDGASCTPPARPHPRHVREQPASPLARGGQGRDTHGTSTVPDTQGDLRELGEAGRELAARRPRLEARLADTQRARGAGGTRACPLRPTAGHPASHPLWGSCRGCPVPSGRPDKRLTGLGVGLRDVEAFSLK